MTNTFLFLYKISAKERGFTTKISIIRRDVMLRHGLTKNYTICTDIIYTYTSTNIWCSGASSQAYNNI